jgi:hypothetical protein
MNNFGHNAEVLSVSERVQQTLKKFWRAHIVDDDPYDAMEVERLEAEYRAAEARLTDERGKASLLWPIAA